MVTDFVIMGNDFYTDKFQDEKEIALGIGRNCRIERAIIDKNVRIGENVRISPRGLKETSGKQYSISDGVIVIPKNVELPPGTVIGDID